MAAKITAIVTEVGMVAAKRTTATLTAVSTKDTEKNQTTQCMTVMTCKVVTSRETMWRETMDIAMTEEGTVAMADMATRKRAVTGAMGATEATTRMKTSMFGPLMCMRWVI